MLTPPDLSDETISACVRDAFGIPIAHAIFLPVGADVNSAVYRVTTDDGTPYFLKLRRGNFNEVTIAVPALLHAQGIQQVMAPIATTTGAWWEQAHGFAWILYPFFAGKNGFEVALSPAQWLAFGASMRAVHTTIFVVFMHIGTIAAYLDRILPCMYRPHGRVLLSIGSTSACLCSFSIHSAAMQAYPW